MSYRIWISAGETSGDVQGAALLAALKQACPSLVAMGMGGPELARAGQRNYFDISELSLMGGVEVLSSLPRIAALLKRVKAELTLQRPDALIVIDAPEFNFRVTRMAEALGIPVYSFIPPKVWAWRSQRVNFLRDHMKGIISILPFEEKFYQRQGMDITYVGNPLVDMVDYPSIASIQAEDGRIGIMPGSRKGEVEELMPVFAHAADRLLASGPRPLSFHCVRAPHIPEQMLRDNWQSAAPLHIHEPENRFAFMRSCKLLWAASGTATLESALAGVPTLVCYRLNPLSYLLGTQVVKVRFISLPNLILDRELFPEFIQQRCCGESIQSQTALWLTHPEVLAAVAEGTEDVRRACGEPGSAARAAEALLGMWKRDMF